MADNNRIEQCKKLRNSDILRKHVDDIVDSFWLRGESYLRNEDLYNTDIDELVDLHSYLIDEIIKVHESENSMLNKELFTLKIDTKDILSESIDGKRSDRIYSLSKNTTYVFIGDLHGDDVSLVRALESVDFYRRVKEDSIRLVFTGDYVDRGHAHLKVLERILLLKYLFPKNIYLLRGNHDGGILKESGEIVLPYRAIDDYSDEMYFPYYMKTLYEKKDIKDLVLLKKYLGLFNSMSYVAIVSAGDKTIFAVHGGIIRAGDKGDYTHIEKLADITNDSIKDFMDSPTSNNLLWSDPEREGREKRVNNRRFHFSQEDFRAFKERLNFDMLIRGHEVCRSGYRYHFDNQLVTVFSSGTDIKDIDDKPIIKNSESAYKDTIPRVFMIDEYGDTHII